MVGLQALQRRVERAADEVAGAVLLIVVVEHGAPLRGEHDLVAPALQQLAEDRLAAAAVAVDVGRVEEGHPRLERRVHDRLRRVGVDPAPEVVAAEPDDGDLERPECARPHPSTLLTHASPPSGEPTTAAPARRRDHWGQTPEHVRKGLSLRDVPAPIQDRRATSTRRRGSEPGARGQAVRWTQARCPFDAMPRGQTPDMSASSQRPGTVPGTWLAGRVRAARSRRARAASCRG